MTGGFEGAGTARAAPFHRTREGSGKACRKGRTCRRSKFRRPQFRRTTRLFRDAGLAFPRIPEDLADSLKERDTWLFSTRTIEISPYNLQHYTREAEETEVEDYALLSHTGHGINSHALQYYILRGPLHMFLHLGWGGVYMDDDAAKASIRECFFIADQIVDAAQASAGFQAGEPLTIVASDFYGSYWLPPGKRCRAEHWPEHPSCFLREFGNRPSQVLSLSLDWLIRSSTV